MKYYNLLAGSFLFFLLIAESAWAVPPVVQDVTVTDVTPVSFSVVWNSDQASSCNITVFTNENGSNDISATLSITPHPTRNVIPAVVTAAQNRGVMKTRVTGLSPSTTYYFRTQTTSIPGAEVTAYPSGAPYLSVTTAMAMSKTTESGSGEIPFSNDLIYREVYEDDGTTPAEGVLLLASVAGGRYPLSGFVGDELASPQAVIDLNNLYTTSNGEPLALQGGQKIILTAFYGIDGKSTSVWVVPRNHNMLTSASPVGLADTILILQAMTTPDGGPDLSHVADINQDGRIGLPESVHIIQVVAQVR